MSLTALSPRRIRVLPILLSTLIGGAAFAADPATITAKELPSLVALYKDLHAHPELSLHEEQTAARLAQELRAAGLDVTEKVGLHGIVGILKNGDGPVILVRTELDALPVKEKTGLPYASTIVTKDDAGSEAPVMHACGHDIHMSCLIGTARVMAQLRDQWKGTLVMIGQPAEERVMGARLMLRAGLFSKFPTPEKALALHCSAELPHGTIGLTEGFALANVDSMDIVVRGVGSHGSMPHLGKDPVVLAAEIVLALQTIVSREVKPGDPAVVTVGSIHGGTKHNIIPDEVRLQITLRSYKAGTRQKLIASVKRIALNLAQAAGMPDDKMPLVTVSEESANALYNQPAFTGEVRESVAGTLGADHVIPREPVMGAEDFSEFGGTKEKVPLCMFWLGTQPPEVVAEANAKGITLPALHSPFFKPVPEPTIETGVKAMTAALLTLMKK
ncbi:amidohydrolase [Chthoniobacter flavus Ellin428]|uniref:Amidohydrolase n=1 Tax=Chthoniobacter flavus Ellin428 TaxID=497964 RepID=B4D8I4_9BACT|nr:amidohydrolase [Chthoniobacter flavus]EDY17206.1 amidohydrolase [Chthoniobacter flavus Ellin428]TCO86969.1 hippurate hydrolase [Chthoniobacter flavus]